MVLMEHVCGFFARRLQMANGRLRIETFRLKAGSLGGIGSRNASERSGRTWELWDEWRCCRGKFHIGNLKFEWGSLIILHFVEWWNSDCDCGGSVRPRGSSRGS